MKTNNVRFSIIIPAYNSSAFISKGIESVLNQTYTGFELILVDDGSQDSTLEICRAYAEKDSRVKVFHKENGGHTSARNEGLKNAIGEYILFLDSDDWISLQTLELCYNEINKNNPDILVYRMKNSNSTVPFKVALLDGYYEMGDLEKTLQNQFIISKDGGFVFPKSLSAKCFRYEVIYKNQLQIPQNVKLGEDGLAFIGALLQSKNISVIANNEKACYYCLVRENSVSRSADPAAFERTISLLLHYNKILSGTGEIYREQFNRVVVKQLYTAAQFVLRSGGRNVQLNDGLNNAMKNTVIQNGLFQARFNFKGYKSIIKGEN